MVPALISASLIYARASAVCENAREAPRDEDIKKLWLVGHMWPHQSCALFFWALSTAGIDPGALSQENPLATAGGGLPLTPNRIEL